MFGFRITYLRGTVTASDVATCQEKTAVEWPPHPDRLFCALIQAWATLGMPENGKKALQWLETCSPPRISCGKPLKDEIPIIYVPVNYEKDLKSNGPSIQGTPLFRLRQPRRIPSAPLSDDRVTFWWDKDEPDPGIREALGILASYVACLGHSSCFVMVELIDSFEGSEGSKSSKDGKEIYVPVPTGGSFTVRVPYPGRFDEIREAFEKGGKPPLSRRRVNIKEWKSTGEPTARGLHDEMILFRLEGEARKLSIHHTCYVTALWRKAIMACAPQPPPTLISGHSPESNPKRPLPFRGPHLALLPLPDVGHRYARSHLMGVGAALPADTPSHEREICLKTLAAVRSLEFRDWGELQLTPCGAAEPQRALRVETWKRKSKVWGSVTPVVLGKHPRKPWGEETEEILKESCKIAGLPEPVEVCVAPISWVLGVPPSYDFPPLPDQHTNGRRFHVHAKLVFDVPVEGPVLVGVGRHRGYGLFRQLPEDGYEA